MAQQKICGKCRYPWYSEGLLPLDALCENCGSFLHTCLNCTLYDKLATKGCRNENGEPGPDPESKNFCEYFIFREVFKSEEKQSLNRRAAEQKWKDLFKDP